MSPRTDSGAPASEEEAVPPAPSKGPGRNRLLTHEAVALAAFDLVDAEGPGAMTMGRLAKRLSVSPMTLYGYVESKDAIFAMLAELLLADLPPVPADRPWAEAMESTLLVIYRRFMDHRHVTHAITTAGVFVREQAALIEGWLVCLEAAGFSVEEAFALQRTLTTYTIGFVFFAIAEHESESPRTRTNWTKTLDPAEFPRLARASDLFAAEVGEAQYVRGLRRILGNFEPSAPAR
jgi:AcrR family transcriptional regulator